MQQQLSQNDAVSFADDLLDFSFIALLDSSLNLDKDVVDEGGIVQGGTIAHGVVDNGRERTSTRYR